MKIKKDRFKNCSIWRWNSASQQENIEQTLLNHNREHFNKVKEPIKFKDKVHESMICNTIREKMLSGEPNREDCNEEKVCKFLCLLKRRLETQVKDTIEVREEIFRTVVKQSKRRSVSSTLTKIDFSMC